MSTTPSASTTVPSRGFTRFLNGVERLGNLLPHPVTLFALFCGLVILASGICAGFGIEVADPRPPGAPGRAVDGTIRVVNLLSGDGLAKLVSHLVTNFTGFAPLGTVLVALLGVGVAERSGLLSAAMRGLVANASRRTVTVLVIFAGVVSNTAAELGYVVLIPMAAMIFHALGRHPLAGLAAAFAGVSGGYGANLLLGTIDPLLSGITEAAARMLDPGYRVGAEVNWYFMATSTFLITAVGTWVTERVVEPKLGAYDATHASDTTETSGADEASPPAMRLTPIEKKGLLAAFAALLLCAGALALATVPAGAPLRNPATGTLAGSPFLDGIVAFIFLFFLVPGVVYGRVTGTLRSDRDIIDAMAGAMSGMGLYLVLVFFASQFVALFGWSKLGTVLAVKGASMLSALGLDGPAVFLLFILICAFVNLMIGSSSAQWAATAPVFVPMLMLLGYAPEVIQAAYRIGDSVTNIITPMMSYFGLILAVASRYQKSLGLGTLIATMLPYSVAFLLAWSLYFYGWVFVFELPVGPGAATHYAPGTL